MKRIALAGVLLLVGLILWGCGQQIAYKEVKQYSIEQFMNTTSIFGSSFSFDEKRILFSSNESGIYNAYSIPVEGGEVTQITDSKDNTIFALSFFPEDDRILYMSDNAGNEIYHIYVRNEDGSVKDLTPFGDDKRSTFAGWAYDQKSFFFTSNKRDQRFMDIYEIDIATFAPEMVYQNDAGYYLSAKSRDKRYFAFHKIITEHNSDMYLYDRMTQELKHLTPHEGDIYSVPEAFHPNSRSLYYTTNEGSEFTYLMRYDIETEKKEKVEAYDWYIRYTYFSWNGKYRVVAINNDAKTEIKIWDIQTGGLVDLPKLPDAEITSIRISKSENLMTFYLNGSRSPNNLYVYDFETGKYRQLTETMNPEIDQNDLVDAQVVRYESFDGLKIPAIVYKPHQIKPGQKAPAMVWVHGGPGGQSGVRYDPIIQYFVNHGYVVIAPNNRGSDGYGKTFFKLDDLRHGEDDLDDCVWAKQYLVSTGYVDGDKVAIGGGSYGGYMTLAGLAFRPDEFAAGVDAFGISNWLRTLKSIPPWWEAFKEALYEEMGNPETDSAYLYSISPLFHADKITKPLIVLQGANDPRVIKPESDDIVEAVKANGIPVEYIVFDDEGHGFLKKENEIKGYKAILDFLDKYLKEPEGS
jgi:dipeptidyl aminopeptidase/acylaminoacyl peptidase